MQEKSVSIDEKDRSRGQYRTPVNQVLSSDFLSFDVL